MPTALRRSGRVAAALAVAGGLAACSGQGFTNKLLSLAHAKGSHAAATSPPAPAEAVEKNGKLAFEARPGGALSYTVKTAVASAGSVTITMTNMSSVPHNVAIQQGSGGPVLGATPISNGGTQSISLVLRPGTYTFFCQVPGHRQAGMYGTLTVR